MSARQAFEKKARNVHFTMHEVGAKWSTAKKREEGYKAKAEEHKKFENVIRSVKRTTKAREDQKAAEKRILKLGAPTPKRTAFD
jgi:uncharacterized protein YabN with tetrapyrrole methylase and pyrophosphatase domain